MNKFTISEKANPNYLAKIVKVEKTEDIPGADRIHKLTVEYKDIVAGKDIKEGDIVVYFPIECQLSDKFLRENNQYKDSQKNNDPSQSGMFEEKRRVKCIKLKKVTSEGFVMPIEKFNIAFAPEIWYNKLYPKSC